MKRKKSPAPKLGWVRTPKASSALRDLGPGDFSEVVDSEARAEPASPAPPPPADSGSRIQLARILDGARTEDEQLRALEAVARAALALPRAAFVVGEPITASAVVYRGAPRAGLRLACVRKRSPFEVSLADAVFPPLTEAAGMVSLYRAWLGLEAAAHEPAPSSPRKVAAGDFVLGAEVELVVLACLSNAFRCRPLGTDREVTLRTAVGDEVPGDIIRVRPAKQWTHGSHPYLSGTVISRRNDVGALGLVPLAVREGSEWDPKTEYWGEEGEPIEAWARTIIARGQRPMFEMEQVVPGADPEDFDSDPIIEAIELEEGGDRAGARKAWMALLAQDLRCLDAHAHLGNSEFGRRPAQALRHYLMGVSLGVSWLGRGFDGVLPWGLVDNRPFLRCMYGLGLSRWRVGQTREAAAVFRKMLWLNPGDHQGARFTLGDIEAGRSWEEAAHGER